MVAMKRGIFLLITVLSALRLEAALFEDNDKVVLLGNTVIERAQKYGYWETSLTLASGKKNVEFRNLAWSGDTVFGHARSYFGPPSEGFDRLKSDLDGIKPNVVIVCYGTVAAFEGEKGLAEFIAGYELLLDMISKTASPREIVLVSPPKAVNMRGSMPDMKVYNHHLVLYSQAIETLAKKREIKYADFNSVTGRGGKGGDRGLSDNGLHFNERGYKDVAWRFINVLGLNPPNEDKLESKDGVKLRKAIVAKNKLFFHQWRPANETYLRLFRKHEQGKNVKELPMFDPFIEEREKEIEALRLKLTSAK